MENGEILAVGTTSELEALYGTRAHEADVIDASGRLVTPGLVDPHTHVAYGGSRENEFEMRLEGATYMEIMNAGGGIHATTRMTREATEDELVEQTTRRLDSFLSAWRHNGGRQKWLRLRFGNRIETTACDETLE